SIAAARATRLTSHGTKHRFIDPSLSPYLQRSLSSEIGNATTPQARCHAQTLQSTKLAWRGPRRRPTLTRSSFVRMSLLPTSMIDYSASSRYLASLLWKTRRHLKPKHLHEEHGMATREPQFRVPPLGLIGDSRCLTPKQTPDLRAS